MLAAPLMTSSQTDPIHALESIVSLAFRDLGRPSAPPNT